MPETEEQFVSAYFDDDAERAAALAALRDAVEYEGVIEGYATREAIERLTEQRVAVTIQKTSEPRYEDPIEQRSKYTDPALQDRLMELEQRAEEVTAPELEVAGAASAMADAGPPQPLPYKVTLAGPIRPQWREELRGLGAEIKACSSGVYHMLIDPLQLDAVRALPYVKSVEDYSVTDSVSSSVLLSIEKKKKQDESGFEIFGAETEVPLETFDVLVHRESDLPRVVEYIKSRNDAEYVEESASAVRFRALPDSVVVASVAKMPEVARIVHTEQPKLFMDRARSVVGLTQVNQAAPPKEWTGKGEIVAILDSGIDATHDDFQGQLAVPPISFRNCSVNDTIGHGTHVAGIIGGSGKKSNQKIRGVAPDAKLVIVGMVNSSGVPQIPLDAGELFKVAVAENAKILNASWGRRLGSTYDSGSRSVDKFVYENPEVLVVVAAGNEGVAPQGTYAFKSIGAPATAKNVLTVGACLTDRPLGGTWGAMNNGSFPLPAAADDPVAGDPEKVAGISSRGPTDFGSIKPDVLAPGTYIQAPKAKTFASNLEWKAKDENGNPVKPDDGYVFISGTSMATPIVSGLAAVLRQYLREERNTPNPSAALMKAILISATKPIAQRTDDLIKQIGFPDFDQGFGRIDVSLVIPDGTRRLVFADVANDSPLALESRAPAGGARKSNRTYKLKLAAGAKAPLVITLAWTDPPGIDLQNNIQLDVRGPANIFTIGNAAHIFRKDPNFDAVAPNGMVLDKRNNVAQVRIAEAPPGDYLIRVAAQNTVLPPQGYALAVVGNIDGDLTS